MSQENVEIVRRLDDAFIAGIERGDFGAPFETGAISEDYEFIADARFAEQRSYRGREGFVEFMERWTEDFDELSIQRQELIDAGNDRVFGSLRTSAIGKRSGAPLELEYCMVWELEAGRLARTQVYFDRDEALEAAGLRA